MSEKVTDQDLAKECYFFNLFMNEYTHARTNTNVYELV